MVAGSAFLWYLIIVNIICMNDYSAALRMLRVILQDGHGDTCGSRVTTAHLKQSRNCFLPSSIPRHHCHPLPSSSRSILPSQTPSYSNQTTFRASSEPYHPTSPTRPSKMALNSFFQNKIESMKLEIIERNSKLRRLEAQRNDLNSRGEDSSCHLVCTRLEKAATPTLQKLGHPRQALVDTIIILVSIYCTDC